MIKCKECKHWNKENIPERLLNVYADKIGECTYSFDSVKFFNVDNNSLVSPNKVIMYSLNTVDDAESYPLKDFGCINGELKEMSPGSLEDVGVIVDDLLKKYGAVVNKEVNLDKYQTEKLKLIEFIKSVAEEYEVHPESLIEEVLEIQDPDFADNFIVLVKYTCYNVFDFTDDKKFTIRKKILSEIVKRANELNISGKSYCKDVLELQDGFFIRLFDQI